MITPIQDAALQNVAGGSDVIDVGLHILRPDKYVFAPEAAEDHVLRTLQLVASKTQIGNLDAAIRPEDGM